MGELMRDVWRVWRRDVRAVARVPLALVIVIGAIITPALYAWFNIIAFWDPYNNTGTIKVSVADLDRGAVVEQIGELNAGSQVVENLKANKQLDWQFVGSEGTAVDDVRSGRSFAAIVIPPEFSADLGSITSGHFTRPNIRYYVNEKTNAIAPKVTDVGATQIERGVTSTFASQVAKTVTEQVRATGITAERKLTNGQGQALQVIGQVQGDVRTASRSVSEVQDGVAGARGRVATTKGALATVSQALGSAQGGIRDGQVLVAAAQRDSIAFTDSMSSVFVRSTGLLADAAARANGSVATMSSGLLKANGQIGSSLGRASEAVTNTGDALDQLNGIAPENDALNTIIGSLQSQNADLESTLGTLRDLNATSGQNVTTIANASGSINRAVQSTSSAAQRLRSILLTTIPSINQDIASLQGSGSALSGAIGAQRGQLAQASALLDDLDSQLAGTQSALGRVHSSLGSLSGDIDTVRTDVTALGTSAAWDDLRSLTGLNTQQIADFVSAPVQLDERDLFPVATYGSGMAALFTNLSLWIGAFVLMVMFALEVDREGFPNLTATQAYLSRWLLLAGVTVVQALLVCSGDLVIGVQHVSTPAFLATGVVVGLAYLCIIYALSVSFGHIGRWICVVMVIIQIPGASGIYPIQMMPSFFRALYPLFPFTYGINAMRGTIGGFYGDQYWEYMGVLLVFAAVAFILGILLRRHLGNFKRMFNRELERSELFVGEEVAGTRRIFGLGRIARALADRAGYREVALKQARRFARLYPRLLRGAAIGGIAIPLGVGVVSVLGVVPKAAVLGLWVGWFLLITGFLIVVEYIRDSLERQLRIGDLSDSDLRLALSGQLTARTRQINTPTALQTETWGGDNGGRA